jgi:L-alanine-DL-glutamate epimerase-like enolase superfamily enzyme
MGSPVNVAAFVQFGAAIPNYALMEPGSSQLLDIVDEPLTVEAGHLTLPAKPGIGIRLREEMLARYPYRGHVIQPAIRRDGSVAH